MYYRLRMYFSVDPFHSYFLITGMLTRVRLFSDLSQLLYCHEYIRMRLGSFTFNTATKDTDLRVTAINMAILTAAGICVNIVCIVYHMYR